MSEQMLTTCAVLLLMADVALAFLVGFVLGRDSAQAAWLLPELPQNGSY